MGDIPVSGVSYTVVQTGIDDCNVAVKVRHRALEHAQHRVRCLLHLVYAHKAHPCVLLLGNKLAQLSSYATKVLKKCPSFYVLGTALDQDLVPRVWHE